MTEAPLRADGLTKRYGRTVALRDVTLELPVGSLTALVGPNAAGKSTLIRTFVGFERPSAGRVAVAGVDPVRDRAGALAHLGYIPQTPALYHRPVGAARLPDVPLCGRDHPRRGRMSVSVIGPPGLRPGASRHHGPAGPQPTAPPRTSAGRVDSGP